MVFLNAVWTLIRSLRIQIQTAAAFSVGPSSWPCRFSTRSVASGRMHRNQKTACQQIGCVVTSQCSSTTPTVWPSAALQRLRGTAMQPSSIPRKKVERERWDSRARFEAPTVGARHSTRIVALDAACHCCRPWVLACIGS